MVESLRMDPVARKLSRDVGGIRKLDDCLGSEVNAAVKQAGRGDILLLENLRFYPEEEANDSGFAQELASLAEIYVNECFSASHRAHASIVGIPKFLPHAAGFHFAKEIEVLSQVLEGPRRPVVIVVGGVKEDKFRLIPKFLKIADFVLVGGWLLKRIPQTRQLADGKKIFACLTPDGRDITKESANRLAGIIEKGGTVVWSGPMGIYEDERDIEGTRIIAEAIANSRALRIAGGGDTETAINFLGLKEKFDWISSGGGAMLEFLAEGTLPGIEALKE
jgi:phosphoglycerate kinase